VNRAKCEAPFLLRCIRILPPCCTGGMTGFIHALASIVVRLEREQGEQQALNMAQKQSHDT
jgi:hypothetical protein